MTDVATLAAEVERARTRIAGRVVRTPLREAPALSALCGGARVLLKLENHQPTGSFKLRGAFNRLLALDDAERRAGVVAASSGNHGLAVAHAARTLGLAATVYAPETASAAKLARIADLGAEVVRFGDDCLLAEGEARARARASGRVYVSPYDDLLVAAGQGTCGAEILEDLPQDGAVSVHVSLGGGGLAAGIGAALAVAGGRARLIASSPAASPAVHACLEAGRWVETVCGPTLSDATAGGVDPEAITLPLCRALLARSLVLEEAAIADALRLVHRREGLVVEGAAALAVAGLLADRETDGAPIRVVVLCGGNVDAAALRLLAA